LRPVQTALADALLDRLVASGDLARDRATFRLPTHRVALGERADDLERLLAAIGGEHEATPPDLKALQASGVGRDVVEAAARAGVVVRIGPELVVTPALVARAAEVVRAHGAAGATVSAVREALGTTRKYAVPLLEHLDRTGVTRRVGDLRFPRDRG
jgi:selenocysteine-specific elongation factor